MAVKTFSTGEVLTAADTNTYLNNGGLVYVNGTTFSAATNASINGCFTSTYDNYRILIRLTASITSPVRMRVRSATSTTESGTVYDRFGFSVTAGVIANETITAQTSLRLVTANAATNDYAPVIFDFMGPNLGKYPVTAPISWNTSDGAVQFMVGRIQSTTAYTGLEIYPDAGNITGSMRVYGYRQA